MYWWIALVMLTSGLLGGAVNSFRVDAADGARMPAWQCVVVGVAAAFIVPLFLNMISSGLISEILGSGDAPPNPSGLFVLAGFCLVAAISSRQFIDTVSERLLAEVRKATEKAEEAEATAAEAIATVESVTEPEEPPGESLSDASDVRAYQEPTLSDSERKVMQTMVNSSFTSRSLAGLSKQSGLSADVVNPAIASLMEKGLVAQTVNQKGNLRWYLTTDGRVAVARI